jgi:hypothetical protein
MKHMMFTKGVEEPVIEVTHDDTTYREGDNESPVDSEEIEDSGSEEETEDDSSKEVPVEDDKLWNNDTTRLGHSVRAPLHLIAEVGASAIGLIKAEENYYALLDQGGEEKFDPEELICIGAALGGGFPNTQEPHVKKYKDALKGTDKDKWEMLYLKNMKEW